MDINSKSVGIGLNFTYLEYIINLYFYVFYSWFNVWNEWDEASLRAKSSW